MPDYACFKCGSRNELIKMHIEWDHIHLIDPLSVRCSVTVKCTNKKCSLSGFPHGERACNFFKRVYQEPEKIGQMDLFEEVAV